MAKRKTRSSQEAAVVPSKGKKTTFDDVGEADLDMDDALAAGEPEDVEANDRSDEDSDDAPEAVGMAAGKASIMDESRKEEQAQKAKKEAARLRSQKLQALKAGPSTSKQAGPSKTSRSKGVREEDNADEDPAAKRLRERMERAMDDGSGDSMDEDFDDEESGDSAGEDGDEDDEEEDGEDDEDDEDEMGSFHTESGSEGSDEEGLSDDSEQLVDGPLTDQEQKMRAMMDAAMAAADRRSGILPSKLALKSASSSKGESSKRKLDPTLKISEKGLDEVAKKKIHAAEEEVEDETLWDLEEGFGPKPLSSAVLAAAEKADEEAKRRNEMKAVEAAKRKDLVEGKKKKKSKRRKIVQDTKQLDNGKTLHLLPPKLETGLSRLPPVHDVRSMQKFSDPRKKFMSRAMKASGQIPGKGAVDGRKRAPVLLANKR